MARKCVFCGERTVSKEHVIPKWVGQVLPKGPKPRWRHRNRAQVWATDHLDFTVKRVCRACNHGWMEHDIEDPARPALSEMIQGKGGVLSPIGCERVAAWTLKTHAMAQFLHDEMRPITEELRASLYERKVAPPHSRVWLAAYQGHPTHGAWGLTNNLQLAPGQDVSPDEIVDGEMMTLCIGHLVLQSFKWSSPPTDLSLQFGLGLPEELVRFLLPIWPKPSDEREWPPEWTLDTPDSLAAFAQTWTNTGPPPS